MQMVDLIIAVCLAGDPSICRNEHLYFESRGSLERCMFEAMPAVADWAGRHPEWRVSRFHCEWVNSNEERT
jgi:hypothetical protein